MALTRKNILVAFLVYVVSASGAFAYYCSPTSDPCFLICPPSPDGKDPGGIIPHPNAPDICSAPRVYPLVPSLSAPANQSYTDVNDFMQKHPSTPLANQNPPRNNIGTDNSIAKFQSQGNSTAASGPGAVPRPSRDAAVLLMTMTSVTGLGNNGSQFGMASAENTLVSGRSDTVTDSDLISNALVTRTSTVGLAALRGQLQLTDVSPLRTSVNAIQTTQNPFANQSLINRPQDFQTGSLLGKSEPVFPNGYLNGRAQSGNGPRPVIQEIKLNDANTNKFVSGCIRTGNPCPTKANPY